MERILFAGFLLIAAVQDLKQKEVDVWIYLLFGAGALALGLGRQMAGGGDYNWPGHLASAFLGAGLLGAAVICRGGIGAGDGCFFLVSGLFLEFWDNLMLLCYGTLLCGLSSLVYLVWLQLCKEKNAGKYVVPFLPFVVPPGVWLVLRGWVL